MRTNKQKLRSKSDVLFHEVCLKLNPNCLLCGNQAQQIHHFRPKGSYGILRYTIINGVALCRSCHFKLTFQDTSLQAKIAEIKGLRWFRKIEKLSKGTPANYQTTDWYKLNIKRLENILNKL